MRRGRVYSGLRSGSEERSTTQMARRRGYLNAQEHQRRFKCRDLSTISACVRWLSAPGSSATNHQPAVRYASRASSQSVSGTKSQIQRPSTYRQISARRTGRVASANCGSSISGVQRRFKMKRPARLGGTTKQVVWHTQAMAWSATCPLASACPLHADSSEHPKCQRPGCAEARKGAKRGEPTVRERRTLSLVRQRFLGARREPRRPMPEGDGRPEVQ
jgi:hypothetical protein